MSAGVAAAVESENGFRVSTTLFLMSDISESMVELLTL